MIAQLKIEWNAVLLFRKAIHLWVILFIATALPAIGHLWLDPISPCLPQPSIFSPITNMFCGWAEGLELIGVMVILIACVHQLLRPQQPLIAMLIWTIFNSLMQRAWLAGSGGQQLIENMLFWLIFIPEPRSGREDGVVAVSAFWIMRLQVLLAYISTALHKLTGTHWLDGTALGIAASDAAFGPAWTVQFPLITMIGTWVILLFQLTFPIAVWWKRTRVPWMIAGLIFHLSTAIWLAIPEMAAAFVVCYLLWLDGGEARWFRGDSGRSE